MLLGHTPRTGRRPPRSTPLSERLPFERQREGTNVPNHPTLLPTDHDRSTPFSFSATSRFLPPTRRLFWSRLRSPHRYLLRFLNPSLSFSCTSRLSSFYFLLRFSTLARALALCCSCNHLFQHRSSLTPFYLYFVVFIFPLCSRSCSHDGSFEIDARTFEKREFSIQITNRHGYPFESTAYVHPFW